MLGWKVSSARLVSRTSGQVYWTVTDPGVSNLISPSAVYWLPNIPSWVDHARLEMSFVIYYWGAWGPVYYLTPPYSSEEEFIVLDEPKVPMSPAWVSVLRYSCRWGRGTNNLDDAAQAITFGVFFQRLGEPGPPGFGYTVKTSWTDLATSPPTLKLKAILDEWNAGRTVYGNCLDISCFTMVALCSVGMDFSVRQLTGTIEPSTVHFLTNLICPIGSDPAEDDNYRSWAWLWHQICVRTGAPMPPSNDAGVWDPTGAQKEDLNGNGYRNPPAHHPSHSWPQKDYWQKPHTQVPGAWLGLVNEPPQEASDPQLFGLGTWKSLVDMGPWPPRG